jgi:DNA mismatch repair protein MutL
LKTIRFLNTQEIQSIAAGEVIERPASIVKELLENSIDAQSNHIEITIENGGKDYISISDNGTGMNKEDLSIALLPHTTSKLSFNEDNHITVSTYGFRGEALATIAAISKLEIKTRQNTSEHGNSITSYQSVISPIEPCSCSTGTHITIQSIFDPVPARKKFLKSRETEWNAIESVIIGTALANPHIEFMVKHDKKIIYNLLSVKTIAERALQLTNNSHKSWMIPCIYIDDMIEIEGIISGIEYGCYDRSNIHVLINKRLIKQYKITQSLIKPYQSENFTRRYPVIFISVTIDPQLIDINVHPRKEEVAFLHPKKVEQSLQKAISKTLEERTKKLFQEEKKELIIPAQEIYTKPNFDFSVNVSNTKQEYKYNQYEDNSPCSHQSYEKKNPFHNQTTFKHDSSIHQKNIPCNNSQTYTTEKITQDIESYTNRIYLGTFAKTYLLFSEHENLIIIDQHALHERILYEKFIEKEYASHNEINSLIIPLCFVRNEHIITIIEENKKLFHTIGIDIDTLNTTTFIVRGTSLHIKNNGIEQSCETIIQCLLKEKNITEIKKNIVHDIYASMSCKAAVKAGDVLSKEHIEELIAQSNLYKQVSLCPHGRPTYYVLSKYMIDSLFKRK